jgi:glycosyltransferase involved in cell wall biosynthesis
MEESRTLRMKISLIVTTKNEEQSIDALFDSIQDQTHLPDEVIIADADSTDATIRHIQTYAKRLPLSIISLPADANRSVGRNRAIEKAKHEHILITDAGCVLHPEWIERMVKGFESNVDVVAGFYQGKATNIFERCIIPYVLVMPDKLNIHTFLPATRSMGMKKSVWKAIGGFDEQHRYAEDYEFARKLQEKKYQIKVIPDAIVYWRPRSTLQKFARMIYEHAYGDGYSHTWRPKVWVIYIRYFLFLSFLLVFPLVSVLLFGSYLLYSIAKNYRYVSHWKSCFYLPLLQVTSDLAVMWGTLQGIATSSS